MSYIHTIRVGDTEYTIAPAIDDISADPDKTWSAQKLSQTFGQMDAALDAILAIQNDLLGGESQ